jgi:uncharacterized protein YbjT (DUF2867 family)
MILVTGATGTIGRALVRLLQARELPFKALVRSETKGASLHCDYIVGDFDQPESLTLAVRGVDALLLNGPAGDDMVRQQTAVIDAARAAGVKRLVKISSRGADAESSLGIARGHGVMERVLASSDLAWSVLRPSTFMQNLLRSAGTIRSVGKIFGAYGSGRIAFVDCEDIAACSLQLLSARDDAHVGKTYTLSGPAAVTYSEVAAACSAALGKPVAYVDLPPDEMLAQLTGHGMPRPFAETMVKLMVQFSTGGAAQTSPSIPELLGRPARSVERFFADHAAAFG